MVEQKQTAWSNAKRKLKGTFMVHRLKWKRRRERRSKSVARWRWMKKWIKKFKSWCWLILPRAYEMVTGPTLSKFREKKVKRNDFKKKKKKKSKPLVFKGNKNCCFYLPHPSVPVWVCNHMWLRRYPHVPI